MRKTGNRRERGAKTTIARDAHMEANLEMEIVP